MPPNAARRGVEADFVLPARQAAVFELVRREDQQVTPLPRSAAYVVNGSSAPYKGTFLFVDDPKDLDELTAMPRWRFGILGAENRLVETGVPPTLPVPEELLSATVFSLDLWTHLEPDTEVIEGPAASPPRVGEPVLGLRIRTTTLPADGPSTTTAVGFGTHWIDAAPALGVSRPLN